MEALFQAMIRLYPEEYQEAFGEEMLTVLTNREADLNPKQPLKTAWFVLAEIACLLRGIVSEHMAKRANPQQYRYFPAHAVEAADLAANPAALESRLKDLIRLMERAIAHHDFQRARFYSNEERKTRNLLSRIQNVHAS